MMEEPLWLAEDARDATRGRLVGSDTWMATGVSIDSRTLQRGDLFVALSDARDGHDFLDQAFAAGASAALVSDLDKAGGRGPLLVVPDVLAGLRALGAAARERAPAARRVGVTGSVGKTSTKEALAVCLAACGETHASVKSYNNHWGVPLTLARMHADAQFGVFEIGMNHRGEIAPLAQLVRPHAAIVTWIAPAHIENLGSLEAIADEKGDIFSALEGGGVAIYPNEAPHSDRLAEAARRAQARALRFGREPGCEARLLGFATHGEGLTVDADILGRTLSFKVGASGEHWAMNSVAALAAVASVGADVQTAAGALAAFEAPAGRGRALRLSLPVGPITVLDDSYNANPASMEAAFKTLAARTPGPGGRRIAALGDMLELGPREREYHADLAAGVAGAADLVFCAGPRMGALWEALPPERRGVYCEDAAALAPRLAEALRSGDVLLIKGSNGSRMFTVVEALTRLDQA